jgi:hypothetical protein
MKDSKKERRISNLKDMIDSVSDSDVNENIEEYEEDAELINYLNEDQVNYDDLEIDDEFIYRPSDETEAAMNLEENINEDFLIKTPKEKEIEQDESNENDESYGDYSSGMSDGFDKVMNAKIGRTPILAILSTLLGLLLLVVSAMVFTSRSDRVIDNVVSGESNFISVIFLIFGALFLIYGIYKIIGFKNPLEGMSNSIDSIEKGKTIEPKTKSGSTEEKVIPKSDIPLDKENYKIGEFSFKDLKYKFKKTATTKQTSPTQEDLDQIPPAREKPEDKKGLTAEEIEELEYQQAVRENESIDDIFAEVEDIDEMPIISIDSENKK